jgi:hypothetical protein
MPVRLALARARPKVVALHDEQSSLIPKGQWVEP